MTGLPVVIVTGMPRSGTSWLGQILASNPHTAFRTEPLFSYRFKNRISVDATDAEIREFFDALLEAEEDRFLLQSHLVESGAYPAFDKSDICRLAYKTTRHHELIPRLLASEVPVRFVAIVRHPCGALNSWFRSEREFHAKGCTIEADWESGACRKDGPGEYWGFADWLSSTHRFVRLSQQHAHAFKLLKYSDLVDDTRNTARALFTWLGLEWSHQTERFLAGSHTMHHDDPYAVFKSREVKERWKEQLDPVLARIVIQRTAAAGLTEFLS